MSNYENRDDQPISLAAVTLVGQCMIRTQLRDTGLSMVAQVETKYLLTDSPTTPHKRSHCQGDLIDKAG